MKNRFFYFFKRKLFISLNPQILRIFYFNNVNTVLCIDNFKFLSLQHGYGSEQIANCSFKEKFVDFQGKINESVDFVEKAAIILNCSIVITTDTSIAHLSGACGKRTLLLLKKVPDWRWGIKGKKTFWYENMELFRQKEKNNWQEVMDRVLIRLEDILNS